MSHGKRRSKSPKKLPRHQRKVEDARREVEARVDDLRTALGRELKWLPRGQSWTLPLVGIAVGVVLALGRKKSSAKKSAGSSSAHSKSTETD